MYIRSSVRKNKDGTTAEYLQLAHNEWNKESKRSETKVLFNLGRREGVDIYGLKRLAASIQKYVDSDSSGESVAGLQMLSAKELGGTWFLDQMWKRLGVQDCLNRMLEDRGYEIPIERAIFSMVANRILDPTSKLSVEHWVNEQVYIPNTEQVSVHQLYRSMDFLLEVDPVVQEDIFFSVATLLNLEVDLVYFDTTSTYFEIEYPDEHDEHDKSANALRQFGYSKDHRSDLPQIVIGLAVTKEGIPIRCWVFSGNTSDVSIVEEVKKDLNGWRLGRIITVWDRGFASEENFIKMQSAGGHYIIGEKMRSGKPEVEAALSKKGRFTEISKNTFAKEAIVGDGERRVRYVIVKNPKEAEKDKHTRQGHIDIVRAKLVELGELTGKAHTKAVCALIAHKVYGKYLKTKKDGSLEINRVKIVQESKLDGKYLLRTSDDTLSLKDIVLGYKQLMDVERGFRTIKSDLELRPVYHRKSDRIRAHVLICWLALLVIRVAESETENTWFHLNRSLDSLKLVSFQSHDGKAVQTTEISQEVKNIFSLCKIKLPPKLLHFQSADFGSS